MKFTKFPENTFKELQLNAGILVKTFAPTTGVIGDIIGATSGGASFKATPSYRDDGDGIDGCPKNTKEFKKLDSYEIKMSGKFVSVTPALAKDLIASADVDGEDATHIIPRNDILSSDFKDLWWVGDYSDKNGDSNGGFIAIHMMNTLSTGGFSMQSEDKGKGTFDFEYTAHYSAAEQNEVPFELFIKAGTAET